MIASTPVARWTWGREDVFGDPVYEALNAFKKSVEVMVSQRLIVTDTSVIVSIPEAGSPRSLLYKGEFTAEELLLPGRVQEVTSQVGKEVLPGEQGSADLSAYFAGVLVGDGSDHRENNVFLLAASVLCEYLVVDLQTFSDAWMPYDLKGREQAAVCEANRPRLAAALRGISEAVDAEIDPDDPTWFGKPTEDGIDNYFDEDGSASDVWGSFEMPRRYGIFRRAPGFTYVGYARDTDEPVVYVPVYSDQGLVLGYLWASDADGAASFEPRDDAGDEEYTAGHIWLDRLQKAYDRGLTPTRALAELSLLPDDGRAGRVPAGCKPDTLELVELVELARGERDE
ncbi:hypothetical protein [Streptomyces abikoensis]